MAALESEGFYDEQNKLRESDKRSTTQTKRGSFSPQTTNKQNKH